MKGRNVKSQKIIIFSFMALTLFYCKTGMGKRSLSESIGIEFQSKDNGKIRSVSKFDEKGNLTESTSCDSSQDLLMKHIYKYDDKNNLLEETDYNPEFISKRINTYDSYGNKSESSIFNANDILQYKQKFMYDDRNMLIEILSLNADDTLQGRQIFKYDDFGKLTEEISFDNNGDFGFGAMYKYDGNGNKIEKLERNTFSNAYKTSEQYKYDDKRNLTELIFFMNGEYHYKIVYEYDKNGLMIRESGDMLSKELSVYFTNKYDLYGNLIRTNEYHKGKLLIKELFEYDMNNKMIKYEQYDEKGKLMKNLITQYVYRHVH
jgi:hypothetical protein